MYAVSCVMELLFFALLPLGVRMDNLPLFFTRMEARLFSLCSFFCW
jgi:hypothetical protein